MKRSTAQIKAIMVADQHESFVTRRIQEIGLEFGGIRGDRHFGVTAKADSRQPMYERGTEILNRRQLTVVSKEQLDMIAQELGVEEVLPEWLGANILIEGFGDITSLPMGSRILFPNGTGLICMGENKPCIHPGEMIQQHYPSQPKLASRFVKAGYKRRGIVCAVERPGQITVDDEVKILINDFDNPMQ
ncbi:MOSC domain-containing protein [Bacillus sp. PS06]|uniref:MOSC domain-containing protein n=1 Tax=Bacillus sp. PS06 TaxID=2764176 RepID=UPI0017835D25|nr:MOSC domain-containing protein [Bacillus sp. PS06]MBD8067606.1 MOSC domain-containing protein [Bacillus sp. PS06]